MCCYSITYTELDVRETEQVRMCLKWILEKHSHIPRFVSRKFPLCTPLLISSPMMIFFLSFLSLSLTCLFLIEGTCIELFLHTISLEMYSHVVYVGLLQTPFSRSTGDSVLLSVMYLYCTKRLQS